MNIFTDTSWQNSYNSGHRTGLRFVIEKNVDPEVRRACKEFGVWLRKKYYFPIRVPIYVKASERLKASDGSLCTGTFFGPYNKDVEPYIRIATGDYFDLDLLYEWGKDNALWAILETIAHEISHYFQWINDIELTLIGEERQAKKYATFILDEYSETRKHP